MFAWAHLQPLPLLLSFVSFLLEYEVSCLAARDGAACGQLRQFGQKTWVDFPMISAMSEENLAKISTLQEWKWVTSIWAIKPQEGKGLAWSARNTHFPLRFCLILTNGTGSHFEPNLHRWAWHKVTNIKKNWHQASQELAHKHESNKFCNNCHFLLPTIFFLCFC